MSEEHMSDISAPDGRDTTPATGRRFARWRTRRVAIVAAAAALVVVAGAVVAVVTLGDGDLPAPHVLAHDPVPPEHDRATLPANCGVTAKTLAALTPHARLEKDGEDGDCAWFSEATGKRGDRRLGVRLSIVRAGPGVPNATSAGNSSAAAAMSLFAPTAENKRPGLRTVTGLGDESYMYGERSDTLTVVFRVGNVIASAQWEADTYTTKLKKAPASDARMRADAFRVAADVARALGAPARPAPGKKPSPRAVSGLPKSACAAASKDLRTRLLGDDADSSTGNGDPQDPSAPDAEARVRSCTWRGDDRELTIAIAAARPSGIGTLMSDARREYLRRYLDARAEKPISVHDERYFHALSGLGDQAFCAYVEEADLPGIAASGPARITARVGGALVTVTYGATNGGYDDDDAGPLSREDAVNGAYAVAARAVRAVRG